MVFVVLTILFITHAVFALFTHIDTMPYFYVLRSMIYVGLWLFLFFVRGKDNRPVYKGQHAVFAVGFSIAMYLTVFVVMGIFFGFAKNMMVPSFNRFVNNFLMYGSFAVFGEILRHKIVKDINVNKNTIMISLVTLVFIFLQINNLNFGTDVFFSVIAPIIILNVALSYIAIDGTLTALILLRCVVELIPVLMPVLPNVSNTVWAIFVQLFLYFVLIVYRLFLPKNEQRREVHKPFLRKHAEVIVVVAIIFAFNAGFFPVYPSIILTDSMAGSLDRGSVALVKKINENNFLELREGDIIQYKNERNMLVIHRITEVHAGIFGEPYFTTKGDANERPDSQPVKKEQVRGVVFGSLRHIGMVRVWLQKLFW